MSGNQEADRRDSAAAGPRAAETLFKWVGALVAVGSLVWGVTSFLITSRIQGEARQLEARRPFLDRQLKLYTDATLNASILATSTDAAERTKATQRFFQLYWGNLAMVENGGLDAKDGGVESAMVAFGACLNQDCPQGQLQQLSLKLAHTCRDSLAESWGIRDWKTPSQS
jgi:hypothetical protein